MSTAIRQVAVGTDGIGGAAYFYLTAVGDILFYSLRAIVSLLLRGRAEKLDTSPLPTAAAASVTERSLLSVVIPAYNEGSAIADAVSAALQLDVHVEVVVVDGGSTDGTAEWARKAGARTLTAPSGRAACLNAGAAAAAGDLLLFLHADTILPQGYGSAIQRGVAETLDADMVCICEPDGTFDPDDILKLLPFTADVDVVFGSRTVRIFILSGANMGLFLKWGNWAVAKLTELLFNTVYLSDVGCTYRVLTRDAIDQLRPEFRTTGSAFGYEMMLLTVEQRLPMVQVPVKYQPRVGESSVTGDKLKAFWLGLDMIKMCVRRRAFGR